MVLIWTEIPCYKDFVFMVVTQPPHQTLYAPTRETPPPRRCAKPNLYAGCQGGIFFLFLLGIPFLVGGITLTVFVYKPMIMDWFSARHWEETTAEILSADLKRSRGSKGSVTYEARATYTYAFRGATFTASRVGFSVGSDNIGDYHQRAMKNLVVGARVPCWVNPARPEEAVLIRELRWGLAMLGTMLPSILGIVGGGLLIGGAAAGKEAKKVKLLRDSFPHEPWRWRPEWDGTHIRGGNDGLGILIASTVWLALLQIPLVVAVLLDGTILRAPLALFALLPTALLVFPIQMIRRRLRTRRLLGQVSMQLLETPVSPGFTFAAVLRLSRSLGMNETIQMRVLCKESMITGTGKGRSKKTTDLWSHTLVLTAEQGHREVGSFLLPLRFDLPSELPGSTAHSITDPNIEGRHISWSAQITPGSGGHEVTIHLPIFSQKPADES